MLKDIVDVMRDDLLDPEYAAGLLSFGLNDDGGDFEGFLVSLRDLAKVRGGIAALAEATGLNRESLYQSLSPGSNPDMKTIWLFLKAIGLQMCFAPADKPIEKVVEAIDAVGASESAQAGEPSGSEQPP